MVGGPLRIWTSPANDAVSLAAMLREMDSGPSEFMRDPPKDDPTKNVPHIQSVCFGSQCCKGYECRLHSYLGETFAGDWSLGKCSYYLWGTRNTWATDQYSLTFLVSYNGKNGPICRLQMQITMMHVDIIHRNARWVLSGADYMSRESGNVWFNPLISKHQAFTATLPKNFAAPIGPILPQHLPSYRVPRTPAASNHSSTCSFINKMTAMMI